MTLQTPATTQGLVSLREIADRYNILVAIASRWAVLGHLPSATLCPDGWYVPYDAVDRVIDLCRRHWENQRAREVKEQEEQRKVREAREEIEKREKSRQPHTGDLSRDIIGVVADYFEVSSTQIYSHSRSERISHCRQICMYLLREHSSLSFHKIGKIFGGRDHTTVMYGHARIMKLLAMEKKETVSAVASIRQTLQEQGDILHNVEKSVDSLL